MIDLRAIDICEGKIREAWEPRPCIPSTQKNMGETPMPPVSLPPARFL